MLGGSAVHFSLAASFFTEVRVVGPGRRRLRRRASSRCSRAAASITDDIERVAGGETFFWRGHYEYDLNVAHTDDTQLNVFARLRAEALRRPRRQPRSLFLANIQPDLQRQVRAPVRGRRVRGARLDEPLDRHRAGLAAGGDRRGRLPDPQRRRDPRADRRAEPGPRRPRGDGDGPAAWSSPSAASTAPRSSPATSFFAIPGFLLEDVRDPTGAGDSFAGGFLGYLDSRRAAGDSVLDDGVLRQAMAYGSVLASFNVEEFGTERVQRLTRERDRGAAARVPPDHPLRGGVRPQPVGVRSGASRASSRSRSRWMRRKRSCLMRPSSRISSRASRALCRSGPRAACR